MKTINSKYMWKFVVIWMLLVGCMIALRPVDRLLAYDGCGYTNGLVVEPTMDQTFADGVAAILNSRRDGQLVTSSTLTESSLYHANDMVDDRYTPGSVDYLGKTIRLGTADRDRYGRLVKMCGINTRVNSFFNNALSLESGGTDAVTMLWVSGQIESAQDIVDAIDQFGYQATTLEDRWNEIGVGIAVNPTTGFHTVIIHFLDRTFTPEICVGLQGGRSAGRDEPIAYTIVGNGIDIGIIHATAEIENSRTGCFESVPVPSGTYQINFVQDRTVDHLSATARNVTIDSSDTINLSTTLVEGDLSGNNRINSYDARLMSAALNIFSPYCEGDAEFDARADLNEDGCVTGSDSSILVSNLNP